jgi:hypothetical protein
MSDDWNAEADPEAKLEGARYRSYMKLNLTMNSLRDDVNNEADY